MKEISMNEVVPRLAFGELIGCNCYIVHNDRFNNHRLTSGRIISITNNALTVQLKYPVYGRPPTETISFDIIHTFYLLEDR